MRTITGTIKTITGEFASNTNITFTLVDNKTLPISTFVASTHERVYGSKTVTTDINGHFSITLWENDALIDLSYYLVNVELDTDVPFVAALLSGAGNIDWLDFKVAGGSVSPAVLTTIQTYIDAANAAATSAYNSAISANNSDLSAISNASSAANSAFNAAISATTATAAANRAEAVVIPTTATYSYTQQDWRQSMMSKAEFNALAAERRANRAGSGFDEWGKHNLSYGVVNEGMDVISTVANALFLGRTYSSQSGISKTDYPITNISGTNHKLYNIASNDAGNINWVTLPPAPTVLPSTATLTQQQIDSGVIKHADASNSGLILNGKFDIDTSGWLPTTATLSVVSGSMRVTLTSTTGYAYQSIATVIGKKYVIEYTHTAGTSTGIAYVKAGSTIGGAENATSTSVAGRNTIEFTATATTTYISAVSNGASGEYDDFDNIAVFPADAISRSDLVFLESWHEDVSEKDFVYPLGNTQYLGTTGDSGTPVAGAFAGSATYSLFSDIWQVDSALIGKGYVWSTLSDANKKAFVANPENSCYLDGGKVIQVRYRMRVVQGWGDSWMSPETELQNLSYSSNYGFVKPKGKLNSITTDLGDYTLYESGLFSRNNRFGLNQIGSWKVASKTLTDNDTSVAYEGKCFALPIALVHRRNQGGYNATFNPNGTKTMTMTPTCISDCFNPSNYTATTGYIGTSTSRPDGLFYDQVSVEDFKPANKGADLRSSSKKRTAHQIIQDFAPKVIAGTLLYNNNDTTALTTYKDEMSIRDTSGNVYGIKNRIGNVVTIQQAVANKKGFSVVSNNGKLYLQVADDPTSDDTVQMNLSTIKYDVGVFDV